jgi:hypothetical protein
LPGRITLGNLAIWAIAANFPSASRLTALDGEVLRLDPLHARKDMLVST